MIANFEPPKISVAEYLTAEDTSITKHEYIEHKI